MPFAHSIEYGDTTNSSAGEDELTFYARFIEDSRQPALDAGCGTGHLLIPLLHAGFDIEESDV